MHLRAGRTRSQITGKRAQSETLGFILVFSIMILGALVVVGLGATAISDTEQELSDDRAEKSMTQFDSKAGLVALGEADSQRVTFASTENENFWVREDAGWMNVSFTNRTDSTTSVVMNTTLGAVTYENGDADLAYQGGGVFRGDDSGGQMISPPEFHYRNGTLTLPAVRVTGDEHLGSNAVITQGEINRTFPVDGDDLRTNPLDNHVVEVTVHSEYYRGWGSYFTERTDGDVEYDHERQTATLELVVPAEYPELDSAVASEAVGELWVGNAKVSSYNSTTGQSDTNSGEVKVTADLRLGNNAEVFGDVEVDDSIIFDHPNAVIHDGNLSYGDDVIDSGGDSITDTDCNDTDHWEDCSDKWMAQNASVDEPSSTERLVEGKIAEFAEDNNNEAVDDIANNELDCSGICELPAGTYYFDDMDLDGNDVELNTTDGDIDIAVDGDISLGDENMDVIGDNRVNVYLMNSLDSGNSHNYIGNTSAANHDEWPASQFWLYVHPSGSVDFSNNAIFAGVIYGPGGQIDDGADINLNGGSSGSEVRGSIVGNITEQVNNFEIYFDEALANEETVDDESSEVKITYLHVTINEIFVESA